MLALIDEIVDIVACLCALDSVPSSDLPLTGFECGGMESEWLAGYYEQENSFRESFRHLRRFSKDELERMCSASR